MTILYLLAITNNNIIVVVRQYFIFLKNIKVNEFRKCLKYFKFRKKNTIFIHVKIIFASSFSPMLTLIANNK
jgi:hypothetical protein